MTRSPASLGIASLGMAGLAIAVAAGIAFMLMHGAPVHWVAINIGALVAGLGLVALCDRAQFETAAINRTLVILALVMVSTALLGTEIDGIRRWWTIGPVTLHMAMLVLPAMLVLWTRATPFCLTTVAVAGAALALALQPDRGSAYAMLAALTVIAVLRRRLADGLVAMTALIALATTLLRPDPLQGVAFVEHVIADGWSQSPLWGIILTLGAVALFLPLARLPEMPFANRLPLIGLMAWTAGLLAASLLGAYPTPAIGAGASAILGHAIGLALLGSNKKTEANP